MSENKCGLYLISPPKFELEQFAFQLRKAFAGGAIPVFQLRMKKPNDKGEYILPEDEKNIRDAIKVLMPICHENGCNFILNDNVKLAKEFNCDGIHLGEDDMSVKEARAIVGKNMVIGASCYGSKDKAFTAAEQGADYVAFGQFYETSTKAARGKPNPEILTFWSTFTEIPCVAIGGIKTSNAEPIIEAGADFIAVVTGVWNHLEGPEKAVKEFNDLF